MRPTLALLPHSLVKKDAHMLDAFGKGASEDIRSAKEELYNQVWRFWVSATCMPQAAIAHSGFQSSLSRVSVAITCTASCRQCKCIDGWHEPGPYA